MTVSFTAFCDALLDELTTNIPQLQDVLTHRYAPYDPEQYGTENGERHLAVWPAAEAAESSTPLTTDGGAQLVQVYNVLYWEGTGDESSRGYADRDAASDLLALAEAVRDRLYVRANLAGPASLAGSELVSYIGTGLPERLGSVRWFQIGVQSRTSAVPT